SLRAPWKCKITVLLSGERARHLRVHGDAGGGLVGGGVGDRVFSGSAGGPPKRHAVYGSTGAVGTFPTASRNIADHERVQLTDTHRGAVLRPTGIRPAVGHRNCGTLGWRVVHGHRFGIGGWFLAFLQRYWLRLRTRRFGCCTVCKL